MNQPDPSDSSRSEKTLARTDIIAAGASDLGTVYRNLTGDTDDPFPALEGLLDTAFPGKAIITSGNLDNPFPIAFD